MGNVTKNARTHNIIVFTPEKTERRIPVTEQQFRTIEEAKLTLPGTAMQRISDADTRALLFYGELRTVKGFEERKRTGNSSNASFLCDFWVRHPAWSQCDCRQRHGVLPSDFRAKAREAYPNRMYVQDLTESERANVLRGLSTARA